MIAKLERTQSNAYQKKTNTEPLQTMGSTQVLAFQKTWRSFSPIIVCILAHCMLPF